MNSTACQSTKRHAQRQLLRQNELMRQTTLQGRYLDSVISVMVRNLDGSIVSWNRAAERYYGWSARQAVGSVSHRLLDTVFPIPLREINQQLLEKGYWEGELIHTLSDGSRVKVKSRWELDKKTETQPTVVETNKALAPLSPDTAFIRVVPSFGERILLLLATRKRFWLTPILVILTLMWCLIEFTGSQSVPVLFD